MKNYSNKARGEAKKWYLLMMNENNHLINRNDYRNDGDEKTLKNIPESLLGRENQRHKSGMQYGRHKCKGNKPETGMGKLHKQNVRRWNSTKQIT